MLREVLRFENTQGWMCFPIDTDAGISFLSEDGKSNGMSASGVPSTIGSGRGTLSGDAHDEVGTMVSPPSTASF